MFCYDSSPPLLHNDDAFELTFICTTVMILHHCVSVSALATKDCSPAADCDSLDAATAPLLKVPLSVAVVGGTLTPTLVVHPQRAPRQSSDTPSKYSSP